MPKNSNSARPHYSEKKTWWAIIFVASLSGIGGSVAKEGFALALNYWNNNWATERTLSVFIKSERSKPKSGTVVLLDSVSSEPLQEVTVGQQGFVDIRFKSKPGRLYYWVIVEIDGVSYSSAEAKDISDETQIYSDVTFLADKWSPTDFRSEFLGNNNIIDGDGFVTQTELEERTKVWWASDEPALPIVNQPKSIDTTDAPWLKLAYQEIGVEEVPGRGNNPRITEYWTAFPSAGITDDEIPWVGAFVAWVLKESGKPVIDNATSRGWLNWGQALNLPVLGCVAVFWRGSKDGWAGSVGFFISETDEYVSVIMGNSSNQVKITQVPKERYLGCRWPEN